jgi:GTP-binding protein Era
MSEFKSAFIAIVGRPNAGKSTLLNRLTGEKIAIISNKPQTTRNKILGILNEENAQIVFVDTPGVHRARTRLGDYMNRVAINAIDGVDAAILVFDVSKEVGEAEEDIIKELKNKQIPAILVINKVDSVAREQVLPLIETFTKLYDFKAIVPISAIKGDGVDSVKSEIDKFLQVGPMFYPDDMITDKTEREIASEIIREKLLKLLEQEIPHGTAVEINSMKEEETIIKIAATIYCEKNTHKAIVIGRGGSMLKKVGSLARGDMEKFFGKKIFLELWVKVKDDWRNNNFMLKSLGYNERE